MALSVELLGALGAPTTVDDLARRLEVPLAHLQRELERLERRGYVRRLACGPSMLPVSPGACGWCALRATCDAAAGDTSGGAVRWLRA